MEQRPERKRQGEKGRKRALGIQPMDFLASWVGKPVILTMMTGKKIRGILVGISTYDLALQLADGISLYVFKHSVATIREARDAPEE